MKCDFKQFATDLYEERKDEIDEATIRTCIGRLYYFLYHKIFRWLKDNWNDLLSSYSCGSHERLQYCLKSIARDEKNLKFSQLALKLHSLHSKRCLADYKLEVDQCAKHLDLVIREVDQADQLFNSLVS
ncbi:hypothetical protein [Acinetobacter courvalinii]|uniref:hypothetical protein n=1 Tax=Acinetobacter courvalinii TaxID=280147 RepID=UPI00289FE82A|nr:hypothetical protein [Acinetobacter courvalinii]